MNGATEETTFPRLEITSQQQEDIVKNPEPELTHEQKTKILKEFSEGVAAKLFSLS